VLLQIITIDITDNFKLVKCRNPEVSFNLSHFNSTDSIREIVDLNNSACLVPADFPLLFITTLSRSFNF
jgi:hypothetical protein